MAGQRTHYTKAEAAVACKVSEATIQRDHREGRLPGAYYGENGALLIPVADLVAAGRLSVEELTSGAAELTLAGRIGEDLAALRAELAAARARAEALAEEVGWLRGVVASGGPR